MQFNREEWMTRSAPALAMAILAIAVFVALPSRASAAEPVTVFLLDAHYEPVVRLEKLNPPISEGLRALLAMYALQDGGGCDGESDPHENGLHCVLTTALGVGPQCSAAQIRLVRDWFKGSIPRMSGAAPDIYADAQKPGSLEAICYEAPYTATFQQIWERIRVRQDGTQIFVDAMISWLAREKSGRIHYRTTYKVEDHSITTLSHEEVALKGGSKKEEE
jgi:hypothetical protein